jgi:hypothetical protein
VLVDRRASPRLQENLVNFIERVMRVMTHVNIGAALGLAAWVLWSGWQVVTGQITPGHRVADVKALMSQAHAGSPPPMQLMPARAGGSPLPRCHEPPLHARGAAVSSGADL